MTKDINGDSNLMDNLFDMPKGNVIDDNWSLGAFGGYNPFLDPFHVYLMDLPRKIMWTTFFDYFFDFSKAYDKFMRALTIIHVILLLFSYLHSSEIHALVYDNLLRALKAFELRDLILKERNG